MFSGAQWLGDLVDNVGTALHLPDWGISEAINHGNDTVNSQAYRDNQIANTVNNNHSTYTINGVTYNSAGDVVSSPQGQQAGPSGAQTAPTGNRSYGGTGGGGTSAAAVKPAPSAAQLNPLLASLNSLDTILGNKNAQSQDEYNRAIQGYDAQDALDSQAHDQQVHQNEQNLTANDQKALLSAANGATGLKGVLASLGALNGSGSDIVGRLVGLASNADAGSARQTFNTNATDLNQAWGQTTQQEKQRRDDADATLHNNQQNNQADVLNSRQNIYQQLANLWGAGTSEGDNYASQASSLAPQIAATTKASVAPYAKASSLFSPASLQDYLAGTKNLNVNTTPGSTTAPSTPADSTAINSPVFGGSQKKDNLAGVA